MIGAIQTVMVVKNLMYAALPFESNHPDRLDPRLGAGRPLGVDLLDANTFGKEVQLHCDALG